MATIVNARDVLLQATSPRLLPPGDAAIILTCTTPVFQISSTSVASPTSITFTARLIAMEGTVTFSASSGLTLTSISGNTCVLLASNMTGTSGTVTATLVYRGTTFTSVLNVVKVNDGTGSNGAPGSNGADGSRGAGHFYATGSSWTDAAADTATPGANVVDDVVTISNGSTFVSEKRWTGSAWVATGVVIDGNTIVNGSVTATKINANGLTIRKTDGTVILDAGTGLQSGFEAPGTLNSGISVTSGGLITGIGTGAGTSVANNVDSIIRSPDGALFTTQTSTLTGGIKIRLPVSWTDTMMKFSVDIYEYASGYSCTMEISGYNYSGAYWANCTALVVGSSNVEYPVYFGHDGVKCCIWIGDTTTNWAYPQIRVRDFLAGYAGMSKANWEAGWQISVSSAARTSVSAQVLDTYPAADWAKVPGKNGRPSNDATCDLKLLPRNTTVTGNTITKTAGSNASWDADAYSLNSAPFAYATAMITSSSSGCFFGLNDNPSTDSHYTDITFAVYFESPTLAYTSINGTLGTSLACNAGDVFLITYDGVTVTWTRNGSLWRDIGIDLGGLPLYFDSSFATIGGSISNCGFGPMSNIRSGVTALAAVNDPSTGLAQRMRLNADNILGGIISANVVSAPAGFRAGNVTWNAAGNWVSGSGVAMTPLGLVGYNSSGVAQFSINASTGAAVFAGSLSAATGSFAGSLTAATGTFGAVTIASGGSISSGQTDYNTGTGFWLGLSSGTPKFSIGTAGGSSLRWDGSNLIINNPTMTLPAFTCSITGSLSSSVASGGQTYGNLTASVTGAVGTLSYTWSIVSVSSDSGGAVQYFIDTGGETSVATPKGVATNNQIHAKIMLIVTDASTGRVAYATRLHNPIHGTYSP